MSLLPLSSPHFADPSGLWLIAIGGPSRTGKTTLINHLVSKYESAYQRPRSFTSREKRNGEGLGEYTFVSDQQIEHLYAKGELLNLDVAYGNKYGIDIAHLRYLCTQGIRPIKEIHPQNQEVLKDK